MISRELGTNTLEVTATERALWGTMDAAANPLSQLVMLAGLVRSLGTTNYGFLAIALAASGIALAINPAIATTTTKFVSEMASKAGTGHQSVAGVITTALTTVVLINIFLLTCTTYWREPLSSLVFGELNRFPEKSTVLTLAMSCVGIQQLDAVIAAAIRGLERFRRQAIIELASRGAMTILVIIVGWETHSVTAILGTQCLVYAGFAVVRTLALRTLLPGKRLFARANKTQILSQLHYGGWMWLAAIAGVAFTSGDRIVVGRVLGAAAAGEYSIYVQLTQTIHFVPSSIFAFSLPAFSRLNAVGGESAAIARAYRGYQLALSLCALGLAVALIFAWPLVLRILHLASSGAANFAAVLLAFNFIILSFSVVPYYLLLALGRSRLVSITTSTAISVGLLLMVELIPRYGLVGAAAARLVYGLATLSFLVRARHIIRRT